MPIILRLAGRYIQRRLLQAERVNITVSDDVQRCGCEMSQRCSSSDGRIIYPTQDGGVTSPQQPVGQTFLTISVAAVKSTLALLSSLSRTAICAKPMAANTKNRIAVASNDTASTNRIAESTNPKMTTPFAAAAAAKAAIEAVRSAAATAAITFVRALAEAT